MRIVRLGLLACLAGLGLFGVVADGFAQDDSGTAYSIEIPGTIDPATERWLGEALDERNNDRGHVDVGRLELILQEQRQEQVEWALERVEVQLELAHDHAGEASDAVGCGRAGRPSTAAAPPSAHACGRGGPGGAASR